jgi:hypothetical protein
MQILLLGTNTSQPIEGAIDDIDTDAQAAAMVLDTLTDPIMARVVRWELYDDSGLRTLWERSPDGTAKLTYTRSDPKAAYEAWLAEHRGNEGPPRAKRYSAADSHREFAWLYTESHR